MSPITDEAVEAALSAFISSVREQDDEWTDEVDEEILLVGPSGDYIAPLFPMRAALEAALPHLSSSAPEAADLEAVVKRATEWFDSLSPEEQAAHRAEQATSFARGMGPCEHGVLDFETCPDCRAKAALPSGVRSGDAQDIANRLRRFFDAPGDARRLALDAAMMIEYLNSKPAIAPTQAPQPTPDAAEELEVVAWLNHQTPGGEILSANLYPMGGSTAVPLVRQSDAQAIIEKLRAAIGHEADYGAQMYANVCTQQRQIDALSLRAEAAEARLAEAERALRFYAADGSWQDDIAPDPAGTPIPYTSPAAGDRGARARAFLASRKEG